jgi:RNase P/RNase MRP subunit p29
VLIGKTITIRDAKNKSLAGKTGKVLDETRHTLTIQTQTTQLTIIKDQIITIEEKP